jgi:uncharacterized protein (TIGR03435 family)
MKWFKLIAIGTVVAVSTQSFSQKPAITRSTFEVASIKPSTPGMRESMSNPPGRFLVNNLTLKQLIGFAYRPANAQPPQIAAGPNWIADDQWTIEAKIADGDTATGADIMALRIQSLLEDRFALKLHREMREQPVYALVVDKGGLKIAAVDPPPAAGRGQAPPSPPRPGPGGTLPADFMPVSGRIMAGPGTILASAVSMAQIAFALNRAVDRPIIDRTNLKAYFNVRLQFAPDALQRTPPAADAPAVNGPTGPSIFTAVQEQLGLRLEPSSSPMEVLVIDSVQKPTEN